MSHAVVNSIQWTGAQVGDLVEGLEIVNRGMVLKLKQEQSKGSSGPLIGRFELIEAGTGEYAEHLANFLGQTYSARDFIDQLLERINQNSKRPLKTIQIFNCNLLGVVELS